MVHALVLRVHSFHQSLLQYLHIVKNLDKGEDTEINSIGGVINNNGVDTVDLDLEYYTEKSKISVFKILLLPLGAQDPHQPSKMRT